MPTVGTVYDYVARLLAAGRSVDAVQDLATSRYGEPWAETAREMIGRAIAAFAAGAGYTQGGPDYMPDPQQIPYTVGTVPKLRYLLQAYHNPGEMNWIELLTNVSQTLAQLESSVWQLLRETVYTDYPKPVYDLLPPEGPPIPQTPGPGEPRPTEFDAAVYPPQELETAPTTLVVVVARVERLYPITEIPIERGQAVPLPGREIEP